ncbi:MAG: T9SS type A sorting domain-containing protein, partial [Saprospiraceae bacterium]
GYTSTGNWNNVTVNTGDQSGLIVNLINDLGNSTGAILTLDDSFDFYNTVGTTNPNSNLPFLEPATKDSFFGETAPFNGVTNPTGGFTLSNLDPTKYYSFSVFASRISVSDNRETQYTASGQNVVSNTLNASNNTSNTTNILNINPLSNGTISFVVTAGSNNTNPFGFYYLGAIQMITSSTPITNIGSTSLSLVYPNGGEFWEVGKTPYISWDSQNITDVTIEYTIDNGSTWTTLAVVPANTDKYNWTIPNSVSSQCKIKISEGLNTDISDTTFSIIENIGTTYKIVILGSSTAAGTGPSDINNAWVWRYREFLTQVDTRYQIENLAVGGFATYNILPTGTTIPAGISRTIDTEKNVTKAIALNADGIIINLPSNDAASGYSAVDQIANYHLIRNTALTQNIPVWISSPQPRNFGANTTAVNIQLEMVTATPVEFGEYAFDFWTNLGIPPNGNGIIPPYNADGVHMNDAGHLILFERVIAKNIHSIVKNNVDESLSVDLYNFDSFLKIYPNPFKEEVSIKFNQSSGLDIKVSIFDSYGRLVTKILNNESITGDNIIKWNPAKSRIAKGIYLCEIKVGEKTITKKIIFN